MIPLDVLEEHLRISQFSAVDRVFMSLNVSGADPAELLGILTLTFYAKDRLAERAFFLERVEIELRRQLGGERAEKLLETRR